MIDAAAIRYLHRYRSRRSKLAISCFLALSQFLMIVPTLLLVRLMFDRAMPRHDVHLLLLAGAGIAALNLASGALALAVRKTALDLTKAVIRELRADLLAKLFSISRSYWAASDQTLLHTRIVHDSERVDIMSNALISEVLPAAVNGLAISVLLVWLSWKLYLSLLILVPVFLILDRWFRPRLRTRVQRFRKAFEHFSQGVSFVLHAIDLARLQSAGQLELDRQRKRIDELRESSGSMAWMDSTYRIAQQNLTAFGTLIVLVVGGREVVLSEMSLGALVTFYFAFGFLNASFRALVSSIPELVAGRESLGALDRILEVRDLEPYRGTRRIGFEGRFTLRGVWFRYQEPDVLKNVDLDIAPGSRVALVGRNGCGKTTFLHLLCGFYRPQKGLLLADGVPYDELDIGALRETLAVVMQDPVLFSGTISENIGYGNPGASHEEIRHAARIATADEFIEQLAQGYDTEVGGGGLLLSGGQRQKIAVARALLRHPRTVILDEPTSHLDSASVLQLTRNLRDLPEQPTLLIVSHDPNVLREFDVILRVEDGQVSAADFAAHSQGVD